MLPFTKRPGRSEDDQDVITKEDLVQSSSSAGGDPVSHERGIRSLLPSVGEEEMTTLMARANVSGSLPLPAPLPAAGRPVQSTQPSAVRSQPPSVRPPPVSLRSRPMDDEDDDENEGRTVVRGAPKIVKRAKGSSAGASSPAAVIKATLEAARTNTNRRDQLMPGPPADLLEDRADSGSTGFAQAHGHGHTLQSRNSQPPPAFDRMGVFEGPPSHRPPPSNAPHGHAFGAPPSSAPHSFGAPPSSAPGSSPYAPRSYPPVSNGSVSVPGVAMPASMPAHFMTPKYSDPPGTSVTSSHTVAGRPALSWAVALLGCGLFVGVLAVALMQSNDSVADTTASFVDPSRARAARPGPAAEGTTAVAAAATPTQVTQPAFVQLPPGTQPGMVQQPGTVPQGFVQQPMVPNGAPATNGQPVPTGVFGSNPAFGQPAAQGQAQPGVAFAPVNVQPAATPAAPVAAAPAKPAAPARAAWKAPAPAAAPPPAPAPKAAAKAAPAAEEDPAPKKTAKKGGKPSGGSDTDDETKKALEALQKAQLESASSFGEK